MRIKIRYFKSSQVESYVCFCAFFSLDLGPVGFGPPEGHMDRVSIRHMGVLAHFMQGNEGPDNGSATAFLATRVRLQDHGAPLMTKQSWLGQGFRAMLEQLQPDNRVNSSEQGFQLDNHQSHSNLFCHATNHQALKCHRNFHSSARNFTDGG